ncbi:MAG: cupin domain-containing protein [Acidimicrobiia bacterium]|nr:cupin domain-containing protein [Acidimicrobiia bacterium]
MTLHRKGVRIVLGAACALASLGAVSSAQQTGITRTILQQADLAAPGREVVVARVGFEPGAEIAKHTHPGEEIGYVLEGTLVLEIAGRAPVTLKAGEPFLVPAGAVHGGRNAGTGGAQVLATYVVEKGKTLSVPAQ